MSHDLQLSTGDGQILAATAFLPDTQPLAIVVIASALGVPRKVYGDYAAWLAEHGIAALSFDYRGIGDSELKNLKGKQVRFADWGTFDTDAALQWAAQTYPDAPCFLAGNSCGGQLFGLAPTSERLAGAIFIAAQSAHWKHWPMPGRLTMGFMFNIVIPGLSLGQTFPARRLGMSSVNAPAGVTRQWAQWGRLPRYLFDAQSGVDASRYAEFEMPILAYGFDDDDFAPAASIDALCAELPNADIERRQINPAELGNGSIGHFGFFKARHIQLWQETSDWISGHLPAQ